MHDLVNVGIWLQLLSGLIIMGLGGLVASIRARMRPNLAFAVFAVAFGGQFALTNGAALFFDQPDSGAQPLLEVPRMILMWVATAGLIAVAVVFPMPLRRHERRLLIVPAALVVAVGSAIGSLGWYETPTLLVLLSELGTLSLFAALVGVHSFFALRFASTRDPHSARLLGYLAGALVLYSGFVAIGPTRHFSVVSPDRTISAYYGILSLGLLVGVILWLRATAKGPISRDARNIAFLTLAVMLFGLVHAARGWFFGALGIVRLLAVAVLAHAIVKHQLFGIDVKVRWGISKTTVAAVFVAVFFIASEAAQEFFGETLGSQYVGILAAGALVFAFAPLSRFADRVAAKAVPSAGDMMTAYRTAVQVVMRDGLITRREEHHLAHLAEQLGLTPVQALRIHDLVRDGRDSGRGPQDGSPAD